MPSRPTLTRRSFLGGSALVAGAALTGCNLDRASAPDNTGTQDPDAGWLGSLVDPPYDKPDVTLATTDGKPFNLKTDSAGKLSLLFFGYTNCPDVCPIYLGTINAALEAIGGGPGSRPEVLWVGVDTERDTPDQVKRFLANINPRFTGLTGTKEAIDEANDFFKFPPVTIGEPDDNGSYLVGHYSQGIAFTADDLGHRLVPPDVRQAELVRDLPRLDAGTYR